MVFQAFARRFSCQLPLAIFPTSIRIWAFVKAMQKQCTNDKTGKNISYF